MVNECVDGGVGGVFGVNGCKKTKKLDNFLTGGVE